MADRKRRDWLAAAVVVALMLTPPVAYVAGYFTLGSTSASIYLSTPGTVRKYPYRWMAFVYEPAGDVEEALTGEYVVLLPAADEWEGFPANQ